MRQVNQELHRFVKITLCIIERKVVDQIRNFSRISDERQIQCADSAVIQAAPVRV
jgi:hypothetical protein